jgi:hypothetical protein
MNVGPQRVKLRTIYAYVFQMVSFFRCSEKKLQVFIIPSGYITRPA